MRTPKTLLLVMVVCAMALCVTACFEEKGSGTKEPVATPTSKTESIEVLCPCCPPPFTVAAFDLVAVADAERVRAERRVVEDPLGTLWESRESFALSPLAAGDGGCCPCLTYTTSSTHVLNGATRVTLDNTVKDLGAIEFTSLTRGTAIVTVMAEVVGNSTQMTGAQIEFSLEKSEPGKDINPEIRTKSLDVPMAATGQEGSLVQFRESFPIGQTTALFSLRGTALAGIDGDYLGSRVIHVTFLPDIE